MMQNGFRRIALAQGLLPERLATRDLAADVAPSAAPRLDAAEAPESPTGAYDDDRDMLVAGAA
jgi:hypothetical protein